MLPLAWRAGEMRHLPAVYLVTGLLCLQVAAGEPSQTQRTGAPNELSQDSFAMVAPGAESLAPLGTWRGQGAYVNSKRARKMSAFMPMRGRRDGHPSALEMEGAELAALRGYSSPSQLAPAGLFGVPLAVPRQFVEQLEQQLQMRANANSNANANGANPSLFSPVGGAGGLMEAKFRRAFHPMRGKKAAVGELGDPDELFAFE